MGCPTCGEEVRPGQRFCASCGTRLERACANCSALLPEGARFCPECGTPVAGEPDAPAAAREAGPSVERRQVSVLFVDLAGFTELARRLDPEETREFQSGYFERAREIVELYGGTVEKFIGDAVMAVWGAPTSNEDDAERATRAALDLVDAIPGLPGPDGAASLAGRAGVASGEVAVTVGADGQGMVAGDTVNLAARLEAAADPGTVLADEATRRAAEAAIVFQAAGERPLKGFPEPVRLWRADRVVGLRGGSGRTGELEAPFVGRSAELTLLKELFHAAARERRLRVVSVTGQAGIGKSRLAWEFEKYIDGISGDVYWHQGRSPAYGEGITFWALGEMVRRRADVLEGDDGETTKAKLGAMFDTYVEDAHERARLEGAVAVLLGTEGQVAAERGELFGAWRTLFERIADRGPVVLVFEDLQWSDGGLIDFLRHLLEWSRQQPIFVVTLARPELLERFPTWGAGQRNFTSLHLEPLADGEMRELLAGLAPGLPAPTVKAILRRAEGVPLYAVETVRMLVADGLLVRDGDTYRVEGSIEQVSIPASLHALVAARLDSLAPSDRSVLQHASVLGSAFSVEGLGAISGETIDALRPVLDRLAARELVRLETDSRSPERGQYQFVQSVIREVAYGTLTRKDRKERHLAAARYFESRGDEELAGALARHYVDAWRAAGAGPDAEALAAQARVTLRAAADRATNLHSYAQALAFLKAGLDVVTDDAERALILERAAKAAWHAPDLDESERLLRDAGDRYRALGDEVGAARVTLTLGLQLNSTGQIASALELLTIGAETLRRTHPEEESLSAGYDAQLARSWFLHMDTDRAVELADRAIVVAERLDVLDVLVDALITKGSALGYSRTREGQATLYGAIVLADRYGLYRPGLRARHNLSMTLELDDPLAADAMVAETLAIAERLGLRDELLWSKSKGPGRAFDVGDTRAAKEQIDELLADEGLPDVNRHYVLLAAASVAAIEGDPAGANRLAAEADKVGEKITNKEWLGGDKATYAWLAQLAGDMERGVAILEAWVDEVPNFVTWPLYVLGRGLVRIGRIGEARRRLAEVEHSAERGRVVDAFRITLEASIGAAEGAPDAADRFVHAILAWRELGFEIEVATVQLDFATLVGTADLRARAAALDLHDTCLEKGWHGLRALVEPLLERAPGAAATATRGEGAVRTGS